MRSDTPDEQPGNTSKDKLALLEKEEEIREKRKREEEERLAKIAHINKAANAEQRRYAAALQASNIDFSENSAIVTKKANEVLNKLPATQWEDSGPIGIYYEKESGTGYARKSFKFKHGSDSYKVFPEMYTSIGTPITNKRIKEIVGFPLKATGYAERANSIAKAMRRSTGLTADEVVLNNGSLTLMGKKLDSPPT